MNKAVYQDELERGNRTPQQAGKSPGNTDRYDRYRRRPRRATIPTGRRARASRSPTASGTTRSFAGVHAQVRVTDECGRIPLNYASETLLTPVITNLLRGGERHAGDELAPAKEIEEIVDSILDWRDADHIKRLNGAESDYYRSAAATTRRTGSSTRRRSCCWCAASPRTCSTASTGVRGCATSSRSSASDRQDQREHASRRPVLQALLGVEAARRRRAGRRQRGDDPTSFERAREQKLTAIDPTLARRARVGRAAACVLVEARADIARSPQPLDDRGGHGPRGLGRRRRSRSRGSGWIARRGTGKVPRAPPERQPAESPFVTLGELSQRLSRADFVDGLGHLRRRARGGAGASPQAALPGHGAADADGAAAGAGSPRRAPSGADPGGRRLHARRRGRHPAHGAVRAALARRRSIASCCPPRRRRTWRRCSSTRSRT